MVRSLHSYQKLTNSLCSELSTFTLGKSQHGSLHKIELLLEVIEANPRIDLIPVEDLGLVRQLWVGSIFDSLQTAVNLLIV